MRLLFHCIRPAGGKPKGGKGLGGVMPLAEAEEAVCLVARIFSAPFKAARGLKENEHVQANLQGFVRFTRSELVRMKTSTAVDPIVIMRLDLSIKEIQQRLDEPRGNWSDRLGNYREIGRDLATLRRELDVARSWMTMTASVSTAERVEVVRNEHQASFANLGEVTFSLSLSTALL